MATALSIRNLKKTYKDGVTALKGVSFDVEQGDFMALLGPNGAGKSTTIGIISSLINKSDGKVFIFGDDIDEDFANAKRNIGIVQQELNFNMFEYVFYSMSGLVGKRSKNNKKLRNTRNIYFSNWFSFFPLCFWLCFRKLFATVSPKKLFKLCSPIKET